VSSPGRAHTTDAREISSSACNPSRGEARLNQQAAGADTEIQRKEIAMNTATGSRPALQRALCLLLAVGMVGMGLGMGALGMHGMLPQGYSVTITQVA